MKKKVNKYFISAMTCVFVFTISLLFITSSKSSCEEITIKDKIIFDDHIKEIYDLDDGYAGIDEQLENSKNDYDNRYLMYVDIKYVLGDVNQAYQPDIFYLTKFGEYYRPEGFVPPDENPAVHWLPEIITPITKTAEITYIWNFLRSLGYSEYATAGIMGNMQAESGFIPCNLENTRNTKWGISDEEYTASIDNGSWRYGDYETVEDSFAHDGAGYGLVQFTFWEKKERLLKKARERGTSISDIDTQLLALDEYYSSKKSIMNAYNNCYDAAVFFLWDYEKPKCNSDAEKQKKNDTRAANAQAIYNAYATGGAGTGGETYYFQGELPKGYAKTLYMGNTKYGSSTLKESGAGPTAIAMVASKLSMYVTPKDVASESSSYYVKGKGSKIDILTDVERYGLKVTQVGRDTEKVKKALDDGKLVIAVTGTKENGAVTGLFNRTSEQNFIVVFGYDYDGSLICADPDGLNFNNVNNKEISLQFLKGETVGGFFVYEPLTMVR